MLFDELFDEMLQAAEGSVTCVLDLLFISAGRREQAPHGTFWQAEQKHAEEPAGGQSGSTAGSYPTLPAPGEPSGYAVHGRKCPERNLQLKDSVWHFFVVCINTSSLVC